MLSSIQITKEVKEKLHSKKRKGESFEDVIKRLMSEEREEYKKEVKKQEENHKNNRTLKPVRLIG